ncbi:MAG: ABC transporter ATP-binding protein [Candidatus Omnitrophota bacterium]
MSEIILEARNIHKFYNSGPKKLHVLKGINLKIEKGQVLQICGPSGAGKSTLLHILGGLDQPDRGSILLNGRDLSGLSGFEKARVLNQEFGFVFQFYHLMGEFSCLENVMMPAIIKNGNSKDVRDQAISLLEKLGLSDRMVHEPRELSGGEQQRVAIGRALINRPSVVFCDEPTGNLDSEMGMVIINLLKGLNQEFGLTIVVVTHQEDLIDSADRVIHIRDGVLQN